jgi:hypothetical protein
MSIKQQGFFTRLFQSGEDYHNYIVNAVEAKLEERKPEIEAWLREVADEHLKSVAQMEIDARLKLEKETEEAEQERLKAHILSKEPWFEVIDYRGDLMDVSNYRWNQAFIDKASVENGWHGVGPKEVFKRFLAERDYQNRLAIIQEERDKHMEDPEPWFEWTVKGISDEGYPVHMEWNPAFIHHLREQGFSGRNEDEIVKLWLSRMIRFTPQGETHE